MRPIVLVLALTASASAAALAASVPTVRLNNGVDMPVLALGTAGYDNATASDAVQKALGLGLTHVHAAYDYFNLEGVAAGLKAATAAAGGRDKVFVTAMTSPCIHPAAPPQRNVTDPTACERLTTREVEETIGKLGLDAVDLLLLHGPSAPFGSTGPCSPAVCAVNAAQWRAYEAALRAGKTRAIGVSNYCQSCLACLPAGATVPAVNQIQLHVGMGKDPEGLVSYCAEKGVVVQSYSPLAAGGVVTDADCAGVGAAHGNRTAAQAGLRWVLQRAPSLVVKADDERYMRDDLDVFGWALSDAELARLDAKDKPVGQQDNRPSWGCAK